MITLSRSWKPGSFSLTMIILFTEMTFDFSRRGFDAADYAFENAHFNQILRRLRIEDERRMRSMDSDADHVDRYSISRCE